MNVYEKLLLVQNELKAPKNQKNSFGGYKYRSAEDILESVKPLLKKVGAIITLSDSIEQHGSDRYIAVHAQFIDTADGTRVINRALAKEPTDQRGMSAPQMTGSASSYARKYALNGLLCIDDTKDEDSDEVQVTRRRVVKK